MRIVASELTTLTIIIEVRLRNKYKKLMVLITSLYIKNTSSMKKLKSEKIKGDLPGHNRDIVVLGSKLCGESNRQT